MTQIYDCCGDDWLLEQINQEAGTHYLTLADVSRDVLIGLLRSTYSTTRQNFHDRETRHEPGT